MSNLKRLVKNALEQQGVIAIIRGVGEDNLAPLLRALKNANLQVAELTFGWVDDLSTANLIKKAVEIAGDNIFIGAGTVTGIERAKIAVNAGAKFIVTPNFNSEVIEFCNKNGVLTVCGAFTPNEVITAYQTGADYIKIFPANVFGAEYIKALKCTFPQIPMLAFAGVTTENFAKYLDAGVVGVGVGSELINLKAISQGDFAYVEKVAKELLQIANSKKI